jgi:hypothetical protein
MHHLTLVREPNTGLEWLYVDGIQETSGDSIPSEQWMSVINKYKRFSIVETMEITQQYGNRVEWDLSLVPAQLTEFQEGDILPEL